VETTTDNGYRSACCYAPIKLGRKKIKSTNLKVKIWVCCKCGKRDVNILEYNKLGESVSTRVGFVPDVDSVDEAVLESDIETA
jgi:hypothetical protein